jgi:hypothetical protein
VQRDVGLPPSEDRFRRRSLTSELAPHVVAYRATLDVPQETVWKLSGRLAEHRRRLDTRMGRRAVADGAGYSERLMLRRLCDLYGRMAQVRAPRR